MTTARGLLALVEVMSPSTPKDATANHGGAHAPAPGRVGRGMAETFRKGDKVEWNSHGGKTIGTVEKKITSRTEAGGRVVDASPDEPQYLVRSDKSGGDAVHKPDALRRHTTN